MAGSGFDASLVEVRAASGEVDEIAQQLAGGLTDTARVVEDLLSSGWSGGAATAFAAGWARWSGGAEQVVRALGVTGSLLASAGTTYRDDDEATSAALAQIRSVLG